MKLSVVILNYNVRYFLELCLRSVQAALVDIESEIIVVDNKSSDASVTMVKQLFPKVLLIENSHNLGFSKGNNIGVDKASGKYICILNPDVVIAENTFKVLLDYAERQSRLGILGCRLIDGRGQFLPESKRNIPTPIVSIKKILGFDSDYYANQVPLTDVGEVEILVGAFMMIKKSTYQEVGGFDEDYFMYGEDIDLSYKMIKAGYRNVYYGKTAVIHYKGESTLKDKMYAKRFYGAMQIFYNKHFKSHAIFDMMVRFGVGVSKLIDKPTTEKKESPNGHALMTEAPDIDINFLFTIKKIDSLEAVKPRAQLIFDAHTMEYRTIIKHMIACDKKQRIQFRILSEQRDYLIGSDSSEQRGEVVCL